MKSNWKSSGYARKVPPMMISSILSVGWFIDLSCFNLVLTCLTGSYSHCFALRTAGDSGV